MNSDAVARRSVSPVTVSQVSPGAPGALPTAAEALNARATWLHQQVPPAEEGRFQEVLQLFESKQQEALQGQTGGKSVRYDVDLPKGTSERVLYAAAAEIERRLASKGFLPFFKKESGASGKLSSRSRPFSWPSSSSYTVFVETSQIPFPQTLPSVPELFKRAEDLVGKLSKEQRTAMEGLSRQFEDSLGAAFKKETEATPQAHGRFRFYADVRLPEGIPQAIVDACLARFEAKLAQLGFIGHAYGTPELDPRMSVSSMGITSEPTWDEFQDENNDGWGKKMGEVKFLTAQIHA